MMIEGILVIFGIFLDVFAQLEIFKRKDDEEKKRIQYQHKPVDDDEYDSWISSSLGGQ
jgi:hypothetical protein